MPMRTAPYRFAPAPMLSLLTPWRLQFGWLPYPGAKFTQLEWVALVGTNWPRDMRSRSDGEEGTASTSR